MNEDFAVFGGFSVLAAAAWADDVALTIYNDNFGLVKQTKSLDFRQGIGEVRFDDVAAQIDPTSVHILPKSGGISILEQNYQYDLVNTQKIMQKYLGTEISSYHQKWRIPPRRASLIR